MSNAILRGDIYYADLGQGIGSEQEGRRPVVIIQNNVGNKHSPTVIIAAVSSQIRNRANLPMHSYLSPQSGLQSPSVVLLEQLRTIDKRRLGEYIGHLDETQISELDHALSISIGLIEKTPPNLILCHTRANNFYGTGAYALRRIENQDAGRGVCTYCSQRLGYDFLVIDKKRGVKG